MAAEPGAAHGTRTSMGTGAERSGKRRIEESGRKKKEPAEEKQGTGTGACAKREGAGGNGGADGA